LRDDWSKSRKASRWETKVGLFRERGAKKTLPFKDSRAATGRREDEKGERRKKTRGRGETPIKVGVHVLPGGGGGRNQEGASG